MLTLWIFLALWPMSSLDPEPVVHAESDSPRLMDLRFAVGDEPTWALPTFDASAWSAEHPRKGERWWARGRFDFPVSISTTEPLKVRLYALGTSEIYWDGRLIGTNGEFGNVGKPESAGRHFVEIPVPYDGRVAGEHSLAIRLSSGLVERRPGFFGVLVGDFSSSEERQRRTTAIAFLLVGILLVTGGSFVVWSVTVVRDVATTLLGLLTLVVAILIAIEYLRFVWPYPYPLHLPRLVLISLLSWLVSFLLPAFLWWLLRLPYRWVGLTALGLVLVAVPLLEPHFDRQCLWLIRVSIAGAAGLVLAGFWRGAAARWWAAAGLGLCALPVPFSGLRFTDRYFFLGFVGMALVFMVEALLRIRQTELARRGAERRAASVRYDLLRNSIQPHYLMNVLAVAEAWFEEEPRRGREILSSLARQLESFFSISERSLVPIGEELELCRRYLETMSHLLELTIEWEVREVAPNLAVSPGVILTLVENAVRHGERIEPMVVSVGCDDPKFPGRLSVRNRSRPTDARPGTGRGLGLVRALLGEALEFPARLEARQEGSEWVVRFDLTPSGGVGLVQG